MPITREQRNERSVQFYLQPHKKKEYLDLLKQINDKSEVKITMSAHIETLINRFIKENKK